MRTNRIARAAGVLALVAGLPTGAVAQALRLPALFGDHMVLQQNVRAPLWGWAEPGAAVRVSADFLPEALATQAGADGRWQVALPTPGAGGPHTLTIDAGETITLRDVLIGEVWICSGQSNMEWPLARIAPAGEVAQVSAPRVRLFNVEKTIAPVPQDDCRGQWAV